MKNIGVDIGGTFIKCAIVDKKGKVLLSSKTPTPENGRDLPQRVCETVLGLVEKSSFTMDDIYSVGVSTTGVCDSERGVVRTCPNIEGYEDIHMSEYLEEKLKKPAFLDNDANCAALGEYMVYDIKPKSFIFVTLGTGVGGGIIQEGKILRGINGGGGEIGHICLYKGGEKCGCGRLGCWERYASVSALVRQTKAAGFTGDITGKTVFEERLKGNKNADEVLAKWLEYVGEGICDMVNIFQPELIVIGGGVSYEGDVILKPIKKFISENSITRTIDNIPRTQIAISRLFNDAGCVGASFLYTQK